MDLNTTDYVECHCSGQGFYAGTTDMYNENVSVAWLTCFLLVSPTSNLKQYPKHFMRINEGQMILSVFFIAINSAKSIHHSGAF